MTRGKRRGLESTIADRINHALGTIARTRVFLRSDTDTRFIRLRPLTQLIGFSGAAVVIGWTIVATPCW